LTWPALSPKGGATDDTWTVIEAALPHWHPESPYRIAPVILLTDPAFRDMITAHRARSIAPEATRVETRRTSTSDSSSAQRAAVAALRAVRRLASGRGRWPTLARAMAT
jgi:hypothetical protein